MKKTSVFQIVLYALFIAFAAVCSQISFSIGPVPFSMGLFAVYLAGGFLGHKHGALCMAVYVLAGALGLPVFSGAGGGITRVIGPLGGYIIGYVAAAFFTGFSIKLFGEKLLVYFAGMLAGLIVCYIFGTAWFSISSGMPLGRALAVCVYPFLIGDAVKIIAAAFTVKYLKPFLNGYLNKLSGGGALQKKSADNEKPK